MIACLAISKPDWHDETTTSDLYAVPWSGSDYLPIILCTEGLE